MKLIPSANFQPSELPWISAVPLFAAASTIAAPAQTFTTLATFNGSNGSESEAPLVQGPEGYFYGTTSEGGDLTCGAAYGCGAVFKVTAQGAITNLHSFEVTDGANPEAGLVVGPDGNLYRVTMKGGSGNCNVNGGTAFMITTSGSSTTIYSFVPWPTAPTAPPLTEHSSLAPTRICMVRLITAPTPAAARITAAALFSC